MNRLAPVRHTNAEAASNEPKLLSLRDELAGPVKKASLLLLAAVVLILLIACANVANLLLARTTDRAAELSIRSALGASRARLMQQLLTECLFLSFVAATAGLAIALWTTSISVKVLPAPPATQSYSILDGGVLAFGAGLAIASGLLFGLLPAFHAGRVHSFGVRGESASRGSRLIRETLVAAQVTLTIILLAASVSIGRAFVRMLATDRGFDTRGLVTVSVSLDGTTRAGNGRELAYFEEALGRIRQLPGVESASVTNSLPLYANGFIEALIRRAASQSQFDDGSGIGRLFFKRWGAGFFTDVSSRTPRFAPTPGWRLSMRDSPGSSVMRRMPWGIRSPPKKKSRGRLSVLSKGWITFPRM